MPATSPALTTLSTMVSSLPGGRTSLLGAPPPPGPGRTLPRSRLQPRDPLSPHIKGPSTVVPPFPLGSAAASSDPPLACGVLNGLPASIRVVKREEGTDPGRRGPAGESPAPLNACSDEGGHLRVATCRGSRLRTAAGWGGGSLHDAARRGRSRRTCRPRIRAEPRGPQALPPPERQLTGVVGKRSLDAPRRSWQATDV
jgi:hypothetical protein